MIQIPVFIVMVLSIRKISYENDDLQGAGILWFPNLNEADPYLILPLLATILNYVNLGVSIFMKLFISL
jgi:membrane protein insertase Oxa1/YidC/SpoIIIJ